MIELATGFFDSISLRGVLLGLGLFIVTFAVNLAIVSFILVKLPANYFQKSHTPGYFARQLSTSSPLG